MSNYHDIEKMVGKTVVDVSVAPDAINVQFDDDTFARFIAVDSSGIGEGCLDCEIKDMVLK